MLTTCSIFKILKFLEDPQYPSLGPHIKLLGFTGIWHPHRNTLPGRFKQALFYITIVLYFSQYIKCCIYFTADSLLLVLQYAPFHLGLIKTCFFHKDYRNWERLIDYLSSVERDQLAKNNKEHDEVIADYVKRNRRVSYFFWVIASFSNISIFSNFTSESYENYKAYVNGTSDVEVIVFDCLTPFKKEPVGYYISLIVQNYMGYIITSYVIGWDTLVVSIMIFFAGQLKITQLYCSRLIDAANSDKSHSNIAECHSFYTTLIEYQQLFNALISPVMFMYLLLFSVNLGMNIIEIAESHDDIATLMSTIVYVVACLIQLLIFYWYANEVTVESTFVSYSTFESNWPDSNTKLQREVALLGVTTEKMLVFKAGPFNEMSLATFVAILRASYSFFTLLNTTN